MKTRWLWRPLLLALSCHLSAGLLTSRQSSYREARFPFGVRAPNQWQNDIKQAAASEADGNAHEQTIDEARIAAGLGAMGGSEAGANGVEGEKEAATLESVTGEGAEAAPGADDSMVSQLSGGLLEDHYTNYQSLEAEQKQQKDFWRKPRTADGKREQPTSNIGWLAPPPRVNPPEIGCAEICAANEYCWSGKCTYRPWYYSDTPRYSCFPDPDQPGLTDIEKSLCKSGSAVENKETCESAEHCKWTNDAPNWYRGVMNGREETEARQWKEAHDEVLEASKAGGEAIKTAASYAMPGNPIFGSVFDNSLRR